MSHEHDKTSLCFCVILMFFFLVFPELEREDNGNYTCEVRGENSKVLANVTHLVIVRGE